MKPLLSLRYWWFFAVFFFLSFAASLLFADETLKIRVRRGDTLSYLSFKIYGRYDPQIAEILKKENPQVRDIDRIYVGQELRFPSRADMGEKMGGKSSTPEKPGREMETKEARLPGEPAAKPPAPLSETTVRVGKGVVTYLEGQVQVKRAAEVQWSPVHPNMILSQNDQIRVLSQSRAELILDNQSVLRLSENTLLTLQKMEEERAAQKETARMEISLGRLWVRVTKLFNPASRYEVKTPTAIAGVQGTTYQVRVIDGKETNIQVFEGAVNVYNPFPKAGPGTPERPGQVERPMEVAGPREVPGPSTVSREEWTQIVLHQYQQITVTGGEVPRPTSFDPQKERQSDWVRWNEERDADFRPPEILR
jgi:phage tail protein X